MCENFVRPHLFKRCLIQAVVSNKFFGLGSFDPAKQLRQCSSTDNLQGNLRVAVCEGDDVQVWVFRQKEVLQARAIRLTSDLQRLLPEKLGHDY